MQIIFLPPGSQAALNLANATLSNTNRPTVAKNETFTVGINMEQHARKRQRLDHLSEQEKLSRRKLKNRVAAQTARDKKKAKMDELEKIVEALRKENEKLKQENRMLFSENTRLKSQCGESTVISKEESEAVERMHSFESAVLINGPLPQEQECIHSQPLMILLQVMLILLSASGHKAPNKLMKLFALLASQNQTLAWQLPKKTNAPPPLQENFQRDQHPP